MRRTAITALCWAGLALFTAYLLWVNNFYYRANTRTPTYDEAWYLETSLHLYHRLTRGSLADFAQAYRGAFGTKAPLIAVLPLPFYLIFGTSYYSALLVNSFFIVISNVYLFLLGRKLHSTEVGLAAAVFYQTMPLSYGLSRAVITEYGLAALVIVWLYYLAASERLSRGSANFALGVVLGLGLLMKVMFPAFIVGPFLLAWLLWRREGPPPAADGFLLWRACARWPLAALLLPATVIAGPWYASNWKTLLAFAWHSAYGEVGTEYNSGGFGQWALAFINQGISSYYGAALLLLGAAALFKTQKRWRWDGPAAFLLAWLLPPLVAIGAGSNHLIRFVAPLLPVFAIALAAAVFHLGSNWILQAALAVLLVLYPQRLYASLSYFHHAAAHAHAVNWGPFVFFTDDLGWAHPPVSEDSSNQRRVIEALRQLDPGAIRPRYVVVGVEHVSLNANLLSYLNAYEEYPLLFTSLGYAESSPGRAIERIYQVGARFLIMGEGFRDLPPFLNQVNDDIHARIASGELPFRLRAAVPLAHDLKALIYERNAPWVSFAPGSQAPQPSRPLEVNLGSGLALAGYDWEKQGHGLWQITLYWTALGRIGQDYRVNLEFRRENQVLRTEDYPIADGRHPLVEWAPDETVRQSFTVWLIPEGQGDLEGRLLLTPWGIGPAQPLPGSSENFVRLRLTQ